MDDTGTLKSGAIKRIMWSVALPDWGVAVTLTLSCVPLGLPMASLGAPGLPRMLATSTSASQAKNGFPVALRIAPRLMGDFHAQHGIEIASLIRGSKFIMQAHLLRGRARQVVRLSPQLSPQAIGRS
jgi:hypothetical protein